MTDNQTNLFCATLILGFGVVSYSLGTIATSTSVHNDGGEVVGGFAITAGVILFIRAWSRINYKE